MRDVPKHIAIIMDGNGRWARRRGLPRLAGHRKGIETLEKLVDVAIELGIKYITVYSFSKENWKRPKSEIEGLWKLMVEYIEKKSYIFDEKNIQLRVSGDLQELPSLLVEKVKELIERTKNNNTIILNVCLNYSGRYEILQAVYRFLLKRMDEKDFSFPTEEEFRKFLWNSDIPDPDLLIRTSGEIRISNFLLWQIAYTEFYFTKTLWPDFSKEEFIKAVEEFRKRDRRYGGIKF